MTQQPEPGPSTNTSPSDIRRSILEWTNKTAPQHIYTSIKGDARKNERGYVWKCTVFSGAIPPTPELGDRSDIYLDTSSRTIHVKEKPAEWTSWVPSSSINHPLGGKSRLRPHFNHGIRWQTNVAFTSHRAKFRSVSDMTVEDLKFRRSSSGGDRKGGAFQKGEKRVLCSLQPSYTSPPAHRQLNLPTAASLPTASSDTSFGGSSSRR
ncbi:hypothetical protein PILCRDRAFT_17286 [Piloderma croceum F 1598]|uniref:Uncharacterized protein n=1 Tax=Piloderma croceum (strain F 1598) TaxID=765440 RepID=A0A0C3B1T7_PILCF|nr:hypothetical protein PILCRDRAFT_17286 [Piloderma croceum F 1598]